MAGTTAMDCVNCGAPLEAKSRICRFCGALNDVDLRQVRRDSLHVGERSCPRCRERLRVLRLSLGDKPGDGLDVDRCDECHGIFFDPGELDLILDQAESRHQEVDHIRLGVLVEEETETKDFQQVAYVPCPDCGKLMNRRNFGARSGVVVDQCRDHGVWLDGGELRRLVEWARAGGRSHHAKVEAERKAMQERAERNKKASEPTASGTYRPEEWGHGHGRGLGGPDVFSAGFDLFDLLGAVARLLR
ncbi:MAG: zf-TFIIB domain-containing protein [Thermoanaerobaculia bacterium]|nr:zf-TFIIB domain-containing protein [Thermoanaerobaculia bacterium]